MSLHAIDRVRALLIEELMCLVGRGADDPVQFRRYLRSLTLEELGAARDAILNDFDYATVSPVLEPCELFASREPGRKMLHSKQRQQNMQEARNPGGRLNRGLGHLVESP